MQGRRTYPDADGAFREIQPGDYFKWTDGWYCKTPNGFLAALRGHGITEHEDGCITVAPSIVVWKGNKDEAWHGFLEHGVWREC